MINKILFITLSNLGDVVLTLPVLDLLKYNFPESKICVMTDRRAKDVFKFDNRVNKLIIYDKFSPLKEKIKLAMSLRKERYDLVVDLRNTAFGFFLSPKYRSPIIDISKNIHVREKHLQKLRRLPLKTHSAPRSSLEVFWEDRMYINGLLELEGVGLQDRILVVSPGARSHIKRWKEEKFSQVCDRFIEEMRLKVILVGDKEDSGVIERVVKCMRNKPVNLCGKTTIGQLCALLKRSQILISNDSAVMHIASYLNIPILAIFGPTDKNRYGPWSDRSIVIQKSIPCCPCSKAECERNLECMNLIEPEEVFEAAKGLLGV
jgi:ADP-heptose:LPS heptosyltransferase